MFGEGPGLGRRKFQASKVVTICDHLMALRRGELQPEIRRKPASIAFDGLIQGLRRDAVKSGQVNIKDDTVPAHDQNRPVDREGNHATQAAALLHILSLCAQSKPTQASTAESVQRRWRPVLLEVPEPARREFRL
jgi:hypothetical protein